MHRWDALTGPEGEVDYGGYIVQCQNDSTAVHGREGVNKDSQYRQPRVYLCPCVSILLLKV